MLDKTAARLFDYKSQLGAVPMGQKQENEARELHQWAMTTLKQIQEVKRCELVWSSGKAGKQKDLGLILLQLSFLFKKVVVCGHGLVTLSLTINEMLKWLSLLPILMQ